MTFDLIEWKSQSCIHVVQNTWPRFKVVDMELDLWDIHMYMYMTFKVHVFTNVISMHVHCINAFCPLQERHRTKQLLAAQEILFPNLYNSMMAAMKPIMAINKTGVRIGDILNTKGEETDDMDI